MIPSSKDLDDLLTGVQLRLKNGIGELELSNNFNNFAEEIKGELLQTLGTINAQSLTMTVTASSNHTDTPKILNDLDKTRPSTPVPTRASDISNIQSVDLAPSTIVLSNMNDQFSSLWNSFPANQPKESGGVIVADRDGNLSLTNMSTGDAAASYMPNFTVRSDQRIMGVFHTHPDGKDEGGHVNVSLSGGDAGHTIIHQHNIIIAQSGEGQYASVRTAATPHSVDYDRLNDSHNNMIGEIMK